MEKQEKQTFLQSLDIEDLKELRKFYNRYNAEKNSIEGIKRRLKMCEDDMQKELKPSKKERELKENLHIVKNIKKKRKYPVKGSISERTQINELTIDGKKFNTEPLDKANYLRLFFKLKKKSTFNNIKAIPLFLKTLITLFCLLLIAMNFQNLKIVYFLSLISLGSICVYDIINILNQNKKTIVTLTIKPNVSQKQINEFEKILKKDYIKEKENTKQEYENNLLFLESVKDICQRRIELHQNNIKKLTDEIFKIIGLGNSFNEEDLFEIQPMINEEYQKILKK